MRQPDVNPCSSAGNPVAETTENSIGISPNFVGHLEEVYSDVRQKFGRQPEDDMLEIDVNMVIWGIFMSATMKAAVHLGQYYQENSRTTKNTDFDNIKRLFQISQKLIMDQCHEIDGISTIDWNTTIPWVRSTLLNDRAVKLSSAKVYVFSDSVLCLGNFPSIHDQ